MDVQLRRAVAYIAGRIVGGMNVSAVFDYAAGDHFQFGGEVSATQVNVFDYARGCHVGGRLPSLYDYGGSSHLDLRVNGSKVSGYDYGSGHHYEATVTGRSISVFDYGEGEFFSYSL